ncbi:MAG: hypothetical protein R3231_06350 [bacterium]|nr:hypothetical protein [bacterium]
MLIYRGGKEVEKGRYWAVTNGSWVNSGDTKILPGGERTIYLRIAPGLMFILAPVIGLLYFLFLPAAAIIFAVIAVGKKGWQVLANSLSKAAYFEWRPNEAYLAGKKEKGEKKGKGEEDKEN